MSTEMTPERLHKAEQLDEADRERAKDDLSLLSAEEINRRVELTADALDELEDCPVCGKEAFERRGPDDFGVGITAGTCHVCGYDRTAAMAYKLGMDAVQHNMEHHKAEHESGEH